MNDVQKGLIAKEIFEKYCRVCKEKDAVCPLFEPDAYKYRNKHFNSKELKSKECFSIIHKKGV